VNQFFASRNTHGHSSNLVCAFRQDNCVIALWVGSMCLVISRCSPADHLDVLDHALHPDSARLLIVLTLPPRYRCRLDWSLGSCPRAAGWSAATSCFGAISTVCAGEIRSPLRVEGGSRWIRNRAAHESRRDLPVAAGLARCACGTAPPHRDRVAGRDGVVTLALSSSAFLTASRFNFETN
jgi:hypothetical protein